MQQPLEMKPYSPGDEEAILSLFHQCFGKPMSMDYWQWRFLHNPVGSTMIELAWEGNTLAAQYAVSPVLLTIKGEDYLTALSMHTMTAPSFRSRGLFPEMATQLYNRMSEQGYLMVWGFPNKFSHRGFVRDLAWRDIYEIPTLYLDIENLRSLQDVPNCISQISRLDEMGDSLWERVKSNFKIIVKRDKKYLVWRYFQNPQNKYHVLGYYQQDHLLGYVVYKKYQNTYLDIVDILAIDDQISLELVLAVISTSIKEEIIGINMWLPLRNSLHLDLEKLGFIINSPITYWGARLLNPLSDVVELTDVRNWYYSMGDSDVY